MRQTLRLQKVGGLLRFSEEEVLAWIDYERSGKRLFGISDEEMKEYRRRAAGVGKAR